MSQRGRPEPMVGGGWGDGGLYGAGPLAVTALTKDQMPRAHSRGDRIGHATLVAVTIAHQTPSPDFSFELPFSHSELRCAPM